MPRPRPDLSTHLCQNIRRAIETAASAPALLLPLLPVCCCRSALGQTLRALLRRLLRCCLCCCACVVCSCCACGGLLLQLLPAAEPHLVR